MSSTHASTPSSASSSPEVSELLARIAGRKGTCKSGTGQIVEAADGAAVSCNADGDCATLRYTLPGQCKTSSGEAIVAAGKPMTCTSPGDCGQEGASCSGASADQVPVCDKLLNAMPLDTIGSCNFCHGSGFRIHSEPTL